MWVVILNVMVALGLSYTQNYLTEVYHGSYISFDEESLIFFSTYLLILLYMPCTVFKVGDRTVNKTCMVPVLMELQCLGVEKKRE